MVGLNEIFGLVVVVTRVLGFITKIVIWNRGISFVMVEERSESEGRRAEIWAKAWRQKEREQVEVEANGKGRSFDFSLHGTFTMFGVSVRG